MKGHINCAICMPRRGPGYGVVCIAMTGTMKWALCGLMLSLASCSDENPAPATPFVDAGPDVPIPSYTLEQLKDPETCNQCHKRHYQDWVGSMHAYASDDP